MLIKLHQRCILRSAMLAACLWIMHDAGVSYTFVRWDGLAILWTIFCLADIYRAFYMEESAA